MKTRCVLILISLVSTALVQASGISSSEWRSRVEADWLLQERVRQLGGTLNPLPPEADALGGCDGVKDGKWGFHTALVDSPWWQVDLGALRPLREVRVWNRIDAADRASQISILLSSDGETWQTVYQHDGSVFHGFSDQKPLKILLNDAGRFIRVQVPGQNYLHLDEVEVFGSEDPNANLALNKPASQSGISPWSRDHRPSPPVDWCLKTRQALDRSQALVQELRDAGLDMAFFRDELEKMRSRLLNLDPQSMGQAEFFEARWFQRSLLLSHPLLDFDSILFCERVPGSFNHMSDQNFGWWSRPGGGLFVLRGFKGDSPELECLTERFTDPGSFHRPALSSDGKKVLFSWCKHYPSLAQEPNKLDKSNVPEDAFYHLFEMSVDGSDVRRLTGGKYDDVEPCFLPDGRIVFLSTRRGQSLQCGPESAQETLRRPDLPDCYVRCGGGPERPCAVYTLHTLDPNTGALCAISPFEMFEWTPSVARDGSILYSRWDYIDRSNMPFMSLWSIHPDGSHPRLVYGNFTWSPHCTFEPRSIPNSHKMIFTASAHHAQTMGSLVLLDPTSGNEGEKPIKRLTPEVVFPESEGWPLSFFANPWPLSENLYLVSWGAEAAPGQGALMSSNAFGIYLFDASGTLELLARNPALSSVCPLPLKATKPAPRLTETARSDGEKEGRFFLSDVYRGLKSVKAPDVKALRIVAVPAKTHPVMNSPSLGLIGDDPGKCVLGTVPVAEDGSAFFRVPAGVIVFFQALDEDGRAIQTMRSATQAQPGQTLSCIGCHESRFQAPPSRTLAMALRQEPSKIQPGPTGSWPLRFDQLVQPVLDASCVRCHHPQSENPRAKALDLTASRSYDSLVGYGSPSLRGCVLAQYRQGFSLEGDGLAKKSPVLARILDPQHHPELHLDQESLERLVTWMDTCGQRLGSFGEEQERQLVLFRQEVSGLFTAR